jgi:fluoroacetyl-CoA thioesterase
VSAVVADPPSPETEPDYEMHFVVPESKVVPALYPESPEFAVMPRVFATGYLVGLIEWACIRAIHSYLDWPREQSVGTHVDITHEAPTVPGTKLTTRVWLTRITGRRMRFWVEVRDTSTVVGRGSHERVVVDATRFAQRAAASGLP